MKDITGLTDKDIMALSAQLRERNFVMMADLANGHGVVFATVIHEPECVWTWTTHIDIATRTNMDKAYALASMAADDPQFSTVVIMDSNGQYWKIK